FAPSWPRSTNTPRLHGNASPGWHILRSAPRTPHRMRMRHLFLLAGVTLALNPFGTAPTHAQAASSTRLQDRTAGPSVVIQALQLISAGAGWVTTDDHRLLWTSNSGATWRDITPRSDTTSVLAGAFFLSPSRGWTIAIGGEAADAGTVVVRTTF